MAPSSSSSSQMGGASKTTGTTGSKSNKNNSNGTTGNRKVWNEILIQALRARADISRQNGKRNAIALEKASSAIEAVRDDIYTYKNYNDTARIVNFPTTKLTTMIHALCHKIISGAEPIVPPGYVPTNVHEQRQLQQHRNEYQYQQQQRYRLLEESMFTPNNVRSNSVVAVNPTTTTTTTNTNPFTNDYYLKSIKKRGGAYAILLAFYYSESTTMTKSQIIKAAQPYCDDEMESNYNSGRMFGAWKGIETVCNHNLIVREKGSIRYNENARGLRPMGPDKFTLTRNGELFIDALLDKYPDIPRKRQQHHHDHQHHQYRTGDYTFGVLSSSALPPSSLFNDDDIQTQDYEQALYESAIQMSQKSASTTSKGGGGGEEEEEDILREWVLNEETQIGDYKSFNVTKVKRKKLHNLCDCFNQTILYGSGKELRHESFDTGHARSLRVTLIETWTKHHTPTKTATTMTPHPTALFSSSKVLPLSSPPPSIQPTKRKRSVSSSPSSDNDSLRTSRRLCHGSTSSTNSAAVKHHRREVQVRPRDAAAEAAELRLALYKSKCEVDEQKKQKTQKQKQLQKQLQTKKQLIVPHDIELSSCISSTSVIIPKPGRDVTQHRITATVVLVDEMEHDGDDDRKMPAKPAFVRPQQQPGIKNQLNLETSPPTVTRKLSFNTPSTTMASAHHHEDWNRFDSMTETIDIDCCDSNALKAVLRTPIDAKVTDINRRSAPIVDSTAENVILHVDDDDDPILDGGAVDLTESQESCVFIDVTATSAAFVDSINTTHIRKSKDRRFIIYIDNRERNRNATPRTLRMELTRILSTTADSSYGSYWSRIWSSSKSLCNTLVPVVEEKSLSHGDFMFAVERTTDTNDADTVNHHHLHPIPVWIERKRIGDLVSRSYHKEHWFQLQGLCGEVERDSSTKNGICLFLLEGDIRTAVMAVPYGAQKEDIRKPLSHTIDDESGIWFFIGRAILSTRFVRFHQSSNEQSCLRAVAAFASISAEHWGTTISHEIFDANDTITSETMKKNKKKPPKHIRTKLQDRLTLAGIPALLSRFVSEEIGSVENLSRLYDQACTEKCRDYLLAHIIKDVVSDLTYKGSAISWSAAIHRVFFSTYAEPEKGRVCFDSCCGFIDDQASLLAKIHSGICNPDDAVNAALDDPIIEDTAVLQRIVMITVPPSIEKTFCMDDNENNVHSVGGDDDDIGDSVSGKKVFDPTIHRKSQQNSFYQLHVDRKQPRIPTVVMQTKTSLFCSDRLIIFLMDGIEIIELLEASYTNEKDCLKVCHQTCQVILDDCYIDENNKDNPMKSNKKTNHTRDRYILLVRGLGNAIQQYMKKSNCYEEIVAMTDIVLAELNVKHNMIVVQAIRKQNDQEMILRQFAMACFHYQYLTTTS